MKYEPLVADAYFHIYNRGNNKENIFKEDKNYYFFLKLMQKYISSICEVFAYCLLKNHFHLVIKTNDNADDKLISQKFSNFLNSYSKAINKAYDRNGSLFKDRFSRKKIDSEKYLKQLIVYVHLNPEHHGFVSDFKKYKFSSFKSYLSNSPSKLNREFILLLFDSRENFEVVHNQKKIDISNEFTLE